ncbi:MAG: hypothetical protein WCD42_04580 [Rhizomicrobium sp.]
MGKSHAPALCASQVELSIMQLTALQQELMDAALTCGGDARKDYNQLQTSYGPVLRGTDARLLAMFRRVKGPAGMAGYNLFKTNLASTAELRRVQDVAVFCSGASAKATTALGLLETNRKPVARQAALLAYANTAVSVDPAWPIKACMP